MIDYTPLQVASRSRHHTGHTHHGGEHQHQAGGHGEQQQGSHWSGRTSPSNSGVGEPRYSKWLPFTFLWVTWYIVIQICASKHSQVPLFARACHPPDWVTSLYIQVSSHPNIFPILPFLSCRNLLVGDSRVSHEPFLERGVVGEQASQSQVKIAKTAKQGAGSRTSLMFSCEDFYVDSTSVLKDSRHPSHTHLHTPTGGSVTHRVVSISMIFKKCLFYPHLGKPSSTKLDVFLHIV